MNKNRFFVSFAATLAIVIGSSVFLTVNRDHNTKLFETNAECDHVGYHYTKTEPTAIKAGHKEYYVCCKCKNHFVTDQKPVGSFTDQATTEATMAEINDGDDRYIAPLGFTNKFPDATNYLCKVGNVNAVKYEQLYDYPDEISSFTVENITSANVSKHASIIGKNANPLGAAGGTSDKTNKTIAFSGAGVVRITPVDTKNVSHSEASIYLEVVTAKNITSLSGMDGKETKDCTSDYVLLSNSPCWSSLFYINAGHILYGNGFTFSDTSRGTYLKSGGMARGFISVTNGATVENLVIKCRVFPKAFIYSSSGSEYVTQDSNLDTEASDAEHSRYMYQISSVLLASNGTINNCYIYGGRNNVLISGGNVTINNSVLDCGTLANIQVNSSSGSTITLDNVTTIQRLNDVTIDPKIKLEGDTDPAKVYGTSIMVGSGESGETNPTFNINGLKQYNWVSSNEANQITSSSTAKTLFNTAIEADGITKTYDGRNFANTGICALNNATLTINNSESNKYVKKTLSFGGKNGQIYTLSSEYGVVEFVNSQNDALNIYQTADKSKETIKPDVKYVGDVEGAIIASTFDAGNNSWVYKLEINKSDSFTDYTFNKSHIKISVRGKEFDFLFKNSSGESITSVVLSETGTTSYSLVFDATNFVGPNGTIIASTISYNLPLDIIFVKGEKPTLTKTADPSGTAIWVGTGTDAWNIACDVLDGLKVEYYMKDSKEYYTGYLKDKISVGKGKLNGDNNSYTYSCDDFELNVTNTKAFNKTYYGGPVGAGNTLYYSIINTSGLVSSSTASRDVYLSYTFTDKFNNSITFSKSFSKSKPTETTDIYNYSNFADGDLKKCSGCISGDTLISLMDGSKVRADSLKAGDVVASFNHETGKIEPQVILHNEDAGMASELHDVIYLNFSNGSTVKVIGEHGFFDYDLMKYVYITESNFNDYVGHQFAAVTDGDVSKVTLDSAELKNELVAWCSPTTAYNLNIISEDILSMPGGIEGMFNYFDFDEDLKYNEAKMELDIETYGLYTYEEFSKEFIINEYSFDVYNGKYLKVAIGKGLITKERIYSLLERYGKYTMDE